MLGTGIPSPSYYVRTRSTAGKHEALYFLIVPKSLSIPQMPYPHSNVVLLAFTFEPVLIPEHSVLPQVGRCLQSYPGSGLVGSLKTRKIQYTLRLPRVICSPLGVSLFQTTDDLRLRS